MDNLKATYGHLVLNADSEQPNLGDGTLTIATGKSVVSENSPVTISAWDMDLAGSINAGVAEMTIHGAKVSQTIGFGATPANMAISDDELGRITATGGLTVGSETISAIRVYVTDGNTDQL